MLLHDVSGKLFDLTYATGNRVFESYLLPQIWQQCDLYLLSDSTRTQDRRLKRTSEWTSHNMLDTKCLDQRTLI